MGSTATAVVVGGNHTCAPLANGSVRCWGLGGGGQLGYASTASIGDNELPSTVGPVDLVGQSARSISASGNDTCAQGASGIVRCWGAAGSGQLGYGNTATIGDNGKPGSVGPVESAAVRLPLPSARITRALL